MGKRARAATPREFAAVLVGMVGGGAQR